MSINKITYTDKQQLNANSSIQDINKVKATDMNEIKSVVNDNADLQGDLSNLATTEKSSIVGALNELRNEIYFKSGDSLTLTDIPTAGYLTSGKLLVVFSIPLSKSMANVTPSITSIKAQVRNNDNYILGNSTTQSAPSGYNATKRGDNFIQVSLTLASATSGAVNNSACGIFFTATIDFS